MLLAVTVAAGISVSNASVAAETTAITLGVQPSYFQGDYGTGNTVKMVYVPVFLKYRLGNATFKATIPYIFVSSGDVLVSGGTVVGKSSTSGTRNGLGDIWLEGQYKFKTGDGLVPDIQPYAKIKVPTASHSKGLGTGKTDYEVGSTLQWKAGTTLFPFLKGGYRIVGKRAELNLRNVATYEGGITAAVTPHNYLTAMYSGHQSLQRGFASTSDAIVAWDYTGLQDVDFQLYGDKGLSTGSADFGVGFAASIRF